MSYQLGPVTVDDLTSNTPSAVFPISSQYGWARTSSPNVITHQFGDGDLKIEQRFLLGTGKRSYVVNLQPMSVQRKNALLLFWEELGGPQNSFWYYVPNEDGTTSAVNVIFDPEQSLSWTHLSDFMTSASVTLIEITNPTILPSYAVSETLVRFPSAALNNALASQTQIIIPLLVITPQTWSNKENFFTPGAVGGGNITMNWFSSSATSVSVYLGNPLNPTLFALRIGGGGSTGSVVGPQAQGTEYAMVDDATNRVIASYVLSAGNAIYISDRYCSVGSATYAPRLIGHSGISQQLGSPDAVTFTLGNADRALTRLRSLVNLNRADVQFYLFNAATSSLLEYWRGEVKSWQTDEGANFQLVCSDPLYEQTLSFPERTINRTCWKTLGNVLTNCLYGHGAGAGGNPTFCDKGFDTLNGCQEHGMDNYFGGVVANPQKVVVRDNSAPGRPKITATSISSDSMYGKTLQHVYANFTDGTEFPVNCVICSGRDESDFYEAIGIVSEGPIGAFGDHKNQLLDGQPQNFPYSPDEAVGNEPEPTPFSLTAGGSYQYPYKASGVARIGIRRSDPKGIQPTSPDSHSMVATVKQGMQGWVWTAVGAKTIQTLTNPIWVAVNAVLRSRGLYYASYELQQAAINIPSAIAAANICNLQVQTLVFNRNPVQLPVDGQNAGHRAWTPFTPTQPQMPIETQFQFIGMIADRQPLANWLDSILQNCLGFWFQVFGQIYFGIRENAGAAEAFTIGNALFNSYSDTPIKPRYNRLTASFADRDFYFVQNTSIWYDEDYAFSMGFGIPRYEDGQINLSGTVTASQALRVIATRGREELGGVNEFEWLNGVEAQWKTTILALNVFPGMVVSYTGPFLPSGYAKFRVQSVTLNNDYSVSIAARTVTASMYDLDFGPKPSDVRPPWLPSTPNVETVNMPTWLPSVIYWLNNPPLGKPGYSTFALQTGPYMTGSDNLVTVDATVSGLAPVTNYFTASRPTIGKISPLGIPGNLITGNTYYVQICSLNAAGMLSPPSAKVSVVLTNGATSILLSNVVYPTGSVGYQVFFSDDPDTLGHMSNGGNPSSIDGNIAIINFGSVDWGAPTDNWTNVRLRFKTKRVKRVGVLVTYIFWFGPNNQINIPSGIIQYDGQWIGSVMSIVGAPQSGGYWTPSSARIINSSASLSTIYLDNFVTTASEPIYAGLRVVIRAAATTWSATTIGCSLWTGIATNEDAGYLVRIIGGTGVGQVRQVASNTATVHTVTEAWTVMPDASSIYTVEESAYIASWDSPPIVNSNPTKRFVVDFPVVVQPGKSVVVIGVMEANGYESLEFDAPLRAISFY